LNLLYKTGIWAAALALLGFLGLHWFSLTVFIFVSLGIFFSLPSGKGNFWVTYWIFSFSSGALLLLQTSTTLPILGYSWVSFLVFFLSVTLFFFILKLIDYSFANQFLSFSFINTGVLIFFFLSILSLASPFSLSGAGLVLFLGLTLMFREILLLSDVSGKRSTILSMVIGFLGIELSWVVLSLPLGLLNGTAFLTLFFVVSRELLVNHFKGNLTTDFIFRQITFLVLFSVIILAASQWTL
jgi:hypothetical protein